MATAEKQADRRAKRSVRMIKQAFRELVEEKGFTAVTVQDIADRADVNRGTFYAHFPDKYALLDLVIREKFRQLLERHLTEDAEWTRKDLALLIRVVLSHFEDVYRNCTHRESLNPMFEQAVQQELKAVLLQWLRKTPAERRIVPPEVAASMCSWAIFGVANEWSKQRKAPPLNEMADYVLRVLEQGAGGLRPESLPQP
jgi:Transcriptional regulator